jgi:hypothetical protein
MLLNPISRDDLLKIAREIDIFSKGKGAERMLNIVETLGYIEYFEDYIFPAKYFIEPFIQNFNMTQQRRLRATILNYYRKNDYIRVKIHADYLGKKCYEN